MLIDDVARIVSQWIFVALFRWNYLYIFLNTFKKEDMSHCWAVNRSFLATEYVFFKTFVWILIQCISGCDSMLQINFIQKEISFSRAWNSMGQHDPRHVLIRFVRDSRYGAAEFRAPRVCSSQSTFVIFQDFDWNPSPGQNSFETVTLA